MSDDLELAIVHDTGVVAVPQREIEVLVEQEIRPVVIESTEAEVVVVNEDVHIVDEVRETHIVTVGEVGPPGAGLPDGTSTGDMIRYNAVTGDWEVADEPLAFRGLVLTPALASLVDAEGAVYYNSAEKAIKVCTEAV